MEKILREALLDAFNKQKLKMMLLDELNERLDQIVGGENDEDIVFNLIEWAEKKGRLPELIQGAFNSNPGNPKLQKFVENNLDFVLELDKDKFPIPYSEVKSFISILQTIKDPQLIKKSLESSLPERYIANVKHELQKLDDKTKLSNYLIPLKIILKEYVIIDDNLVIMKFANALKEKIQSDDSRNELESWLTNNQQYRFSKVTVIKKKDKLQPYLMVILQPASIKGEVNLLGYLAFGSEENKYNHKNFIPLDNPKTSFKYNQIEIELQISDLIDKSQQKIEQKREEGYQVTPELILEFFLPYPYIFEPIESWNRKICIIEEELEKIGLEYKITVRAYERLVPRNAELRNRLSERWEQIKESSTQNTQDINNMFEYCNLKNNDPKILQNKFRGKIGLKLTSISSAPESNRKSLLSIVLKEGIPIMIWARCCETTTIINSLDYFSNSCLNSSQLLQLALDERVDNKNNLRDDLGILYDEPYRLSYLANKEDTLRIGA